MALIFPRGIKKPDAERAASKLEKLERQHRRLYGYLRANLTQAEADAIWLAGQKIPLLEERQAFYTQILLRVEDHLNGGTSEALHTLAIYKYPPVSITTFICDPYYLDKAQEIYPTVLEAAEELNNGTYVEAILTGGIGPLSCDTEFLTPTGWVRMDEWANHEVAEYRLDTGQIEFRCPESYEVRECFEFLHFQSKYGIDMKLSAHHRVLFRMTNGRLNIISASEMARRCLKNENGFCGKILTTFKAPDYTGVPLTDDQIRLQVAAQADGSFDYRRDTRRCQVYLKKERKQQRLRLLLKAVGIPYQDVECSKAGYRQFVFEAPLRNKSYSWAWGCNTAQLRVITSEINHWGGSFSDNRFATVIKESADFIQYAYSATGWRATISSSPNESSLCQGTPQTLYRVMPSDRIEPSLQGKGLQLVTKVPAEDSKMYCFKTKTGYFVARHNGRIFISPNSAKTTLALYTNAYQLYLLSCMRSPHKLFGLDPSSEILLIFQSITKQLAQGVDYQRFRSMIEGARYFTEQFPFDKDLTSRLVFPNRIEVMPVAGNETAAIGQNVMGGLIDELNYMAVVEKSRASVDKGTYDQAIAVYNSIARRRKSRFMANGKLPGILCLVSSKKYPGQFTDQKVLEAREDPSIYVYDKRMWDVRPNDFGNQGWFHVFIGDMARKPHIIAEGEQVADEDRDTMVVPIPNEFRNDFEKDVINALREVAGISTLARHPFFLEVAKVSAAFKSDRHSIFSQSPVDFVDHRLTILKAQIWKPELPRFVHVDLALSGDSAGLAVGTVSGFKNVSNDPLQPAYMPEFWIDGVLEIRPPRNAEILFSKIREVLFVLKKMGMDIKWVTFDQFQSSDSQQILRQWGFVTGHQSVDDVPCKPYDFLKSAMYEDRLSMPKHPHLQKEILSLEKDAKKGKVDHPPGGSKDTADALAAIVFGLTMRRDVWGLYRIPISMVPSAVMSKPDDLAKKNAEQPDYQEMSSFEATRARIRT